MQLDRVNVLAAFLTIAEERSFTKAAKRLNISGSALSHAVRGTAKVVAIRRTSNCVSVLVCMSDLT